MAETDKLALGLDEIIRLNRPTDRRGGRGGKRGIRGRPMPGGTRGAGSSNGFRTRGGGGLPRVANQPVGNWKHDLYEDIGHRVRNGGGSAASVTSTTKILISNLDYGVTNDDIQELFEDVGGVRTARIHYDASGRSLGIAEVIYERRADAITAQKKYNGVNLDGRPMEISIVGGSENRFDQSSKRLPYNGVQRSGFRFNNQQNNNRGGGNRMRGGRPQKASTNENTKKENLTAEDLDADLEAYRAEAAPKK